VSKEFIQNRVGGAYLTSARRQAKQISYLVESDLQEEINIKYLEAWAERNYMTNDYFLNWVKSIFKTENALQFYKYFRFPIASSALINNKVLPALERVFYADDSYFRYILNGEPFEDVENLKLKEFNEVIFDALLFRHNDILFYDFPETNKPERSLISIEQVVAIEAERHDIKRLAFKGTFNEAPAIIYADEKEYIVYNYTHDIINGPIPHDLGQCPADFISKEPFKSKDDYVTRKSIFSYSIEKLEEYVFLKTLQRMTEPNGSIPIVTQLKATAKPKEGKQQEGPAGDPMSATSFSSNKTEQGATVQGKTNESPLQAGSRISIPPIKKQDGSYDMEAIKHFINFFYTPVEALEYLQKRILEIEDTLLVDLIGDYQEENDKAMNELQVSKGYMSKQDRLRRFSKMLSWIRNRSDRKMIAMSSGMKNVEADCFYGSDFFLETESDLYDLILKSPNSIERKNVLMRLARNRNRHNIPKAKRESILYKLLPFASDKDFEKAINNQAVGEITFQLQTRMDFYVGIFESRYGDILYFYDIIEGADGVKLNIINNLLTDIIKEYYEKPKTDDTPEGVPGTR